MKNKYLLPTSCFVFTGFLLSMVQIKVSNPMLLLERFIVGGGWFEILIISIYAGWVSFHMQDPSKVALWRQRTWLLFSIVFFSQLIIGLLGIDAFLMTGKLHFPIPAMIIAGPVFRAELSVMSILFISTLILTGPAWCSHFCYFGALDGMASKGKTMRGSFRYKWALKTSIVFIIVLAALLLRWFGASLWLASSMALLFGIIGIAIMIIYSRKKKKMVHCVMYCPVGTVVNIGRFMNPMRMVIDNKCDLCMKCSLKCKYDALNAEHIKNKKPGLSCTLCGDCLSACKSSSIQYKFFNFSPTKSRSIYLFLTISIHASCLALARI